MRFLGLGSSLLLAGALMLPSTAKADTVFLAGGLLGPGIPTVFVGVGPPVPPPGSGNYAFTATVQSNVYSTGSVGFTAYATALGISTSSTDFIYAYFITDTTQNPTTDALLHFSVKSGTVIDSIGFRDADSTGIHPSATSSTFISGVGTGVFDFTTAPFLQMGTRSTVLLFATSGAPVLQSGTLADGASDSQLVVSATGPLLQGTPLPLPTSACAGMALLGLLSMGRRRKAKIA